MSARKFHNLLTYAYSIYMYNPTLLNLIDELDKFKTEEFIKCFSYNIINQFIDTLQHNIKIDDFTNKSGIEFCNHTFNFIKSSIEADTQKLHLQNNSQDNFLKKVYCFFNMSRYEVIGFFFDRYNNTFNTYINKLKQIKFELDNQETSEERAIELNYVKDEINKLLITDFLTETLNNFFYNIFNMFKTLFEVKLDTNSVNNQINTNLENTLSIVKIIVESNDKYNTHKEKIKSYL